MNVTLHLKYSGIVRQLLPGSLKFNQRRFIVQMSSIEILRLRQVCFARIGSETKRIFDRLFRRCETRRGMVVVKEVKKIMSVGEFAICLEERRIPCDCLVE